MKPRNLFLLVGAIILTAVVIAYATADKINQGTQNNTVNQSPIVTDWTSYESDKYGFEIMYPSDWTVSAREPDFSDPPAFDGRAKLTLYFNELITLGDFGQITLLVYNNQTADSLIQYFDYDRSEFSETMVAGVKALQVSGNGSLDKPFAVFFNNNEYGFQFRNQDETNSPESFEVAKKILDSIKFTN
jgi:hypothetical protein